MMTAESNLSETLNHFLPLWSVDWSAKTLQLCRGRMKPLINTFGNIRIVDISVENVLEYRAERKSKGISNRTINMEVSLLKRAMKSVHSDILLKSIKSLRENQSAGRAVSDLERQKLFILAQGRPSWFNAWAAMELALNTTLRGCEIRQLRWRDINFSRKILVVKHSKTDAGERIIPLNDNAMNSITRLTTRARNLNALNPNDFLFMACESGRFNPHKPIHSWRTAWRSLTRTAGLRGLRFHDMRHTAITDLLESGRVSEATAMQIAGHISRRMLRHYSHIRIESMRSAVGELGVRSRYFQPQLFECGNPVFEKIH